MRFFMKKGLFLLILLLAVVILNGCALLGGPLEAPEEFHGIWGKSGKILNIHAGDIIETPPRRSWTNYYNAVSISSPDGSEEAGAYYILIEEEKLKFVVIDNAGTPVIKVTRYDDFTKEYTTKYSEFTGTYNQITTWVE